MQISFEQAEKLFEDGFYDRSFAMFEAIGTNDKYDLERRAEAYNMMGVIIALAAPYLSEGDDESGLPFFKKALALDPKTKSATLNVISTYNNSPTSHKDSTMAKIACQYLRDYHWEELPDDQKKSIGELEEYLSKL